MAKKASELLLESAGPFDQACMQVRVMEAVLRELVELKDIKEKHGKTEYYLKQQPLAWAAARKLI